MWRHIFVLLIALFSLCMIQPKPVENIAEIRKDEDTEEESDSENAPSTEKNDSVEEDDTEPKDTAKKDSVGEISNDSDSDNEFENVNEKKDSVEEVEDDNQSPDQEEAKEEGTASEVDEEDTSSPEEDGDKKDKVPVEENIEENSDESEDETASIKQTASNYHSSNGDNNDINPEKKASLPYTKEIIKRHHDHHGHHKCHDEECHHCGDEEHHEGECGHHEHDHHEHDHHHHDHGYEFYEEWGEHGGHEGEHHGHEEGHHHGETGQHCHEDHDEDFHHGGGGGGGYRKKSVVSQKNNKKSGNTNKDSMDHSNSNEEAPTHAKKWWMVGDQWGGWGKDHFGHPHIAHENGGWQYHNTGLANGGMGGSYKSVIPDCCKAIVNSKTKKRSNCPCNNNQKTEHHGGYHFHDHGSGHNNRDHELQGHWTFGYDHFGDDWHDWDHNQNNFDRLQNMEHESHESHGHCGECHHGCSRGCIPAVQSPVRIVNPPINVPVSNYRPAMAIGTVTHTQPMTVNNRVYHVCHDCHTLPIGGSRCLCKSIRQPVNIVVPQYQRQVYIDCDSAVHKFPFTGNCVARTDLPVPKKKKEKTGKTKQGVVYPYLGYGPWAAYPWTADWWGGQGHHGWGQRAECGNGRSLVISADRRHHCDCHHEHEHEHCGHHGHGHHHHGHHHHHDHEGHHQHHHCDHEHHGHHGHHHCHHDCENHHDHHGHCHGHCHHEHEHCGHHGHCKHHCHHDHHHDHEGHHHCHDQCHEHHGHHGHHRCHTCHHCHCHHFFPLTRDKDALFMSNIGSLQAYHCQDVVEKSKDGSASGSKRFCVPIGYRGGYGWPYWHGYPGVGTGLWGWGWPWIKNKVPGSKNKTSNANEQRSSGSSTTTRSVIPVPSREEKLSKKSTKKQTIHVGYGYASGDNYRLGYGYGGMGGVAGFAPGPGAQGGPGTFSRSNIPKANIKDSNKNVPTPEIAKDVTGTKRNSGLDPSSTKRVSHTNTPENANTLKKEVKKNTQEHHRVSNLLS